MNNLQAAEQQLIGFVHASMGYDIISLIEAMGLTRNEWLRIRDKVMMKVSDKDEVNKYFGVN